MPLSQRHFSPGPIEFRKLSVFNSPNLNFHSERDGGLRGVLHTPHRDAVSKRLRRQEDQATKTQDTKRHGCVLQRRMQSSQDNTTRPPTCVKQSMMASVLRSGVPESTAPIERLRARTSHREAFQRHGFLDLPNIDGQPRVGNVRQIEQVLCPRNNLHSDVLVLHVVE